MFDVGGDQPIQQVNLRGATILQAWAANSATAQMSNIVRGRFHHDPTQLGTTWTPETPGANYVYHGSAAHHVHPAWINAFSQKPFQALAPSTKINQMGIETTPGIFTAFSPLRAFLWAAFMDHIPQMTPSADKLGHMNHPWICDGVTYRGLVLFQFYGTQPAPSGFTHYTIPVGKEKQWGDIAKESFGKGIRKAEAWQRFDPVHGQGHGQWPNLIHGLEYEPQRGFLAPFHTNMWRTMWSGGATDHLNSRHAATFSITFDFDEPKPPKPAPAQAGPSKKPKDDGDDGQRKKESKALRGVKKLAKKASTFFENMKPSSQGSRA